jgi:hypothetical protein
MNFLKKGPELKLSEIKVPDFVLDLYLDLKERHLLPIVLILIVAIIAVPIAVGQSSDSPEQGAEEAEASISTKPPAGSRIVVSKSTPGLRRYQQRLDHLRAKDPFKPRVAVSNAEPESSTTESSGSTSGSESGSASAETSLPSESGGASTGTSPLPETGSTETGPGTESEPSPGASGLRYYSYAIDVRVSAGGDTDESAESQALPEESEEAPATSSPRKWSTRRNLPELTMLPSRETPAVIYMGSTKDGKKALMLVSSDVTAIFGDGKCVLGSKTCQLLAMEPGVPETFVYGPAGRTFKIELLKVHLVETKKLNRAPLGKPKKNG